MTTNTLVKEKPEISLILPILGSHIERIGFLRVFLGAPPMYICIPILVIFNLSVVVILYQWILRPVFGIKRVLWKDHVILDRHRIQGLALIDKVNCVFCGYANGLCTMLNTEIDHLSEFDGKLPRWKAFLAFFAVLVNFPVIIIGEFLGIRVIYDLLVSLPLGMHRTGFWEVWRLLKDWNYAGSFHPAARFMIRIAKNLFIRFTLALEQIESSWCPLKHFERREGIIYPAHHEKFFGPDELEAMRRVLKTEGTVSDRKPLW